MGDIVTPDNTLISVSLSINIFSRLNNEKYSFLKEYQRKMKKWCCFSCAESELPDVDVNVTCPPSTCGVRETKANISRSQSSVEASHGRETQESVLRLEASSRLCLDSEIGKSDLRQQKRMLFHG